MRRRFVRFRSSLGDRLISLSAVVEVMPMVRLLSSEHEGNQRYCGLLHFRGRVMPVFDLKDGATIGLQSPDYFLIVTRAGGSEQAIVACEVDDIVEAPAQDCSQLDTGGAHPVEVVNVGGALVEVVNPERLAR